MISRWLVVALKCAKAPNQRGSCHHTVNHITQHSQQPYEALCLILETKIIWFFLQEDVYGEHVNVWCWVSLPKSLLHGNIYQRALECNTMMFTSLKPISNGSLCWRAELAGRAHTTPSQQWQYPAGKICRTHSSDSTVP